LSQKASGSVSPHKHCPVCGISIAPSKDYCSDACREVDENNRRRMSNFRRVTLLLMVAAMVVLIAFSLWIRTHG
jgi:predicted nucleic acid-binding Zn ribbon protein